MTGSKTFDELVARSGLSPLFASHVIARALAREHMWPERLSPGQLAQIAPALERAIRPFLQPDDAERIVAELQLWISMRARSREADAAPEHEGPRA